MKNLFVLAPLIFTGQFMEAGPRDLAIWAFVLFCVASSSTYVLNDYLDREADRAHPQKSKKRPIASGAVSLVEARVLYGVLLSVVVFGVWRMPELLPGVIGYLVLNVLYSLVLKHQPVLDIFTIATGFVLRVWTGAVVLAVPLSSWMFVTTFCLSLYLAAIKRRQELLYSVDSRMFTRRVLARYSVELMDRYAEMAATGALLFYSLYVMNGHAQLVATIPLVMFGMFRYWYIVEQLEGGESPTDSLLRDRQLLAVVCAWALLVMWVRNQRSLCP
jgi:4-hydroxybenzoate polyprenyltransferase